MFSYTLQDCGPFVHNLNPIESRARIAMFATQHGADISCHPSDWQAEAEEYMNAEFPVEGAYWGRNKNGDWGLWPDIELEVVT